MDMGMADRKQDRQEVAEWKAENTEDTSIASLSSLDCID